MGAFQLRKQVIPFLEKKQHSQGLSHLGRTEDAVDIRQVWGNSFNEWRSSHTERLRREEERERTKQRQIMELPPLPRRAAPHPWEDLVSVLSRTARVMGYA